MRMCMCLWKKVREKERKDIKTREGEKTRVRKERERERSLFSPVTKRILLPTTTNMTHILADHKTIKYNPLWTHKQMRMCRQIHTPSLTLRSPEVILCCVLPFLHLGFGLCLFILFFQWSHWLRPRGNGGEMVKMKTERSMLRTLVVVQWTLFHVNLSFSTNNGQHYSFQNKSRKKKWHFHRYFNRCVMFFMDM